MVMKMSKEFIVYGSVTIGLSYKIKADSEKDAINAFYNRVDRNYPCSDDISLDDVILLEDDRGSDE